MTYVLETHEITSLFYGVTTKHSRRSRKQRLYVLFYGFFLVFASSLVLASVTITATAESTTTNCAYSSTSYTSYKRRLQQSQSYSSSTYYSSSSSGSSSSTYSSSGSYSSSLSSSSVTESSSGGGSGMPSLTYGGEGFVNSILASLCKMFLTDWLLKGLLYSRWGAKRPILANRICFAITFVYLIAAIGINASERDASGAFGSGDIAAVYFATVFVGLIIQYFTQLFTAFFKYFFFLHVNNIEDEDAQPDEVTGDFRNERLRPRPSVATGYPIRPHHNINAVTPQPV